MPTVPTVTSERRLQQQGQVSAPSLPRSGYTPRVSGGSGELMGKAVQNLGETVTKVANVMFERQVEENKRLKELEQKIKEQRQAHQLINLKNNYTKAAIAAYSDVLSVSTGRDEFGQPRALNAGPLFEERMTPLMEEYAKNIEDEDARITFLQDASSVNKSYFDKLGTFAIADIKNERDRSIKDSIAISMHKVGELDISDPEVFNQTDTILIEAISAQKALTLGEMTFAEEQEFTRSFLTGVINDFAVQSAGVAREAANFWRDALGEDLYGKTIKKIGEVQQENSAIALYDRWKDLLPGDVLRAANDVETMREFNLPPDKLQSIAKDVLNAQTAEHDYNEAQKKRREDTLLARQTQNSNMLAAALQEGQMLIVSPELIPMLPKSVYEERPDGIYLTNPQTAINWMQSKGYISYIHAANFNRELRNQDPIRDNLSVLASIEGALGEMPHQYYVSMINDYVEDGKLTHATGKQLISDSVKEQKTQVTTFIKNMLDPGMFSFEPFPAMRREEAFQQFMNLRVKNPDGDMMEQARAVVSLSLDGALNGLALKAPGGINIRKMPIENVRQELELLKSSYDIQRNTMTTEQKEDFAKKVDFLNAILGILELKERLQGEIK